MLCMLWKWQKMLHFCMRKLDALLVGRGSVLGFVCTSWFFDFVFLHCGSLCLHSVKNLIKSTLEPPVASSGFGL